MSAGVATLAASPLSAVVESEQSMAGTASETTAESTSASTSENAAVPEIRVVHGSPTAEELAAVVAVLAAVSVATSPSRSDNDQRSGAVRGGWTARERGVRTPLRSGPGGWRASAFPPAR